jgi:2-oxoisovalerate dehydrogenase E2 component (dihydrolipoyl transacylase)
MVKEFRLPDLGEGLTEGEILRWHVQVGDVVELNQTIVEVETAKAAVEIPAKWAGTVAQIFHPEGETVAVGTPIIAIDTGDGAPVEASARATAGASAGAGAAPAGAEERTPVLVGYGPRSGASRRRHRVAPTAPTSPAAPTSPPPPPPARQAPPAQPVEPVAVPSPVAASAPARALAKPPVRKLARDLGVDLALLTGTGPQGTITREDVQAATAAPAGRVPGATGRERRIPVKGVRRLTAENMVASAFTAPHVTEFLTVDVTRSVRVLARLREHPEWREERVSPLLLVAKAVLLAIARRPEVNSTWDGDEIIVKEYVNLGIAAATDRGLVVPNIKDADQLTLRELARALTELVQTAKAGRTTPADMAGGTFSITNVGVFGVDTGTPILPPGEAAILALGSIREMPWVHRGKVKVRQVTTLSLSFDHRIIDGELGSLFLRDIGAFLTDPETALLAWC